MDLEALLGLNRRILYRKIHNFTKDLIRRTIYEFYDKKVAPTVEMVSEKIKLKTQDTDYDFPYGLTTPRRILKKLGFREVSFFYWEGGFGNCSSFANFW